MSCWKTVKRLLGFRRCPETVTVEEYYATLESAFRHEHFSEEQIAHWMRDYRSDFEYSVQEIVKQGLSAPAAEQQVLQTRDFPNAVVASYHFQASDVCFVNPWLWLMVLFSCFVLSYQLFVGRSEDDHFLALVWVMVWGVLHALYVIAVGRPTLTESTFILPQTTYSNDSYGIRFFLGFLSFLLICAFLLGGFLVLDYMIHMLCPQNVWRSFIDSGGGILLLGLFHTMGVGLTFLLAWAIESSGLGNFLVRLLRRLKIACECRFAQ